MNQPPTQLVNKPIRMTRTKLAVLDVLAGLGAEFLEYGVPPYAVSLLAERMGIDLSNLTKTLRALERDGLVVREVALADCWNAIAANHMPRRCVCYWLAATMEQDQARVQAWKAGADERAADALELMFSLPSTRVDLLAHLQNTQRSKP